MSTPNWPIEIGAIYATTHPYKSMVGSRVIAIEDDVIYYEDVKAEGYREWPGDKRRTSLQAFRALHQPQDLSPIAALYAYIERVTEHIGNRPNDEAAAALIDDGLKLLEARKSLITEIE